MLKKLLTLILLLVIFNNPLTAQYSHIELTYQSFRPFIHFQLNFNSCGYNYDANETTYLKGYMDGVNDERYFGYNFADMFFNFNAYREGYQDGFRDRQLLISLRGYNWYRRHCFSYDDYYAPVYAVRIWLDGLSLAFLQAPIHRLPERWQYKAHPDLKKYRKWMANRSVNVERRFKKRIRGYRQKMDIVKKQRRRAISHDRDRVNRKQYGNNRGFGQRRDIDIDRDRRPRNRSVDEDNTRRRTVKKDNRRKRTRETVRKRVRDTQESKRKSRSRSKDRDG